MDVDKENFTIAGPVKMRKNNEKSKKSRSKSIGPGGLDALKEQLGNRRKSAIIPTPRSILKPYHQPSPPKTSQNNGTPNKRQKNGNTRVFGKLPFPFGGDSSQNTETTVALKTEEQQMAEAKEREEQERRDSRRKSLGRRVSFAPEATLHMWHDEIAEDSTTSSASTNSTRRASSLSEGSSAQSSSSPTRPSSRDSDDDLSPLPLEQRTKSTGPDDQSKAQQNNSRRGSLVPPIDFNPYTEAAGSSSPYREIGDERVTSPNAKIDEDSSSDMDDDIVEGSGTTDANAGNANDATIHSIESAHSRDSTVSTSSLDARLREAAQHAGTRGIEYDEFGDMTMEMADDDVTASFQPWVKKTQGSSQPMEDLTSLHDKENVNPFSSAVSTGMGTLNENGVNDDMTLGQDMEITTAVGGILPSNTLDETSHDDRTGKSLSQNQEHENVHGESSTAPLELSGEAMDVTEPIDSIQKVESVGDDLQSEIDDLDEDENMSMDLTAVVGGVLSKMNRLSDRQESTVAYPDLPKSGLSQDQAFNNDDDDGMDIAMDMTTAIGGILSPVEERTEPQNETGAMDFTAAIGGILSKNKSPKNKDHAGALIQAETEHIVMSSPFQEQVTTPSFQKAPSPPKSKSPGKNSLLMKTPSPPKSRSRRISKLSPTRRSTGVLETGSPVMRTRDEIQRSSPVRESTTPKSPPKVPAPEKTAETLLKPSTPQSKKPVQVQETPSNDNDGIIFVSPMRLIQSEKNITTPKPSTARMLFVEDPLTGVSTPSVVLKPDHHHRLSGQGIDKEGLGSPRIIAILNKRSSIGESAETFTPQASHSVRFDDPTIISREVDQEREEDVRRESGRFILEQEADVIEEKDITANLKQMIESMSPKKRKVGGRKSLAVGTAKGLLGKRPVELDIDEDEDDQNNTTKRLKGQEGSPVKQVHLPAPPSKDEVTGKLIREARKAFEEKTGLTHISTPSASSPSKTGRITTPKSQGRFRDVQAVEPLLSLTEKVKAQENADEEPAPLDEEEEPIYLKDFLLMTSIRFMELDTIKHRQIVASHHQSPSRLLATNVKVQFEDCVAAGACTIPMLELYQHSCRELKKYISEGRHVAQQIEEDTYAENPPLFREYINAPPDQKLFMDNQFKNVKTYARLDAKATWYDWRMKLVDGMQAGLEDYLQNIRADEEVLSKMEKILDPVVPELVKQRNQLEKECKQLQMQEDEIKNCDQDKLQSAREELSSLEDAIETTNQEIKDLQLELEAKEVTIEAAKNRKNECLDGIKEAERVREECKGWTIEEVSSFRNKVKSLETKYGWSITTVTASTMLMTYRNELQLLFSPKSFLLNNATQDSAPANPDNSPIRLTYIGDEDKSGSIVPSTEKRFFLQGLQAQLQSLRQANVRIKDLLGIVSRGWDRALNVSEQIRNLQLTSRVNVSIRADDLLAIETTILLVQLRTKVKIVFFVRTGDGEKRAPEVSIVYGETFKVDNMQRFLDTYEGNGWGNATRELEARLKESRAIKS